MKTIIAGSRTATYSQTIDAILSRPMPWNITEVVSGSCCGASRNGEHWADDLAIPVQRFPADLRANGNAAGPIRNRQMAEHADALIAVWDGESSGTKNMIMEAKRRGLRVHIHRV